MEASLLQLYAPRDPLAEVLHGEITLRQFRVMCDGVPRGPHSPAGRAISGPWGDLEWLAYAAASAARENVAVTHNVHRGQNSEPLRPDPIPKPEATPTQKAQAKRRRKKEREEEEYLLSVITQNQQ